MTRYRGKEDIQDQASQGPPTVSYEEWCKRTNHCRKPWDDDEDALEMYERHMKVIRRYWKEEQGQARAAEAQRTVDQKRADAEAQEIDQKRADAEPQEIDQKRVDEAQQMHEMLQGLPKGKVNRAKMLGLKEDPVNTYKNGENFLGHFLGYEFKAKLHSQESLTMHGAKMHAGKSGLADYFAEDEMEPIDDPDVSGHIFRFQKGSVNDNNLTNLIRL